MSKKNTMITDWLDKYGDPQIEKKVMERLEKITKELIINEVYNNYFLKTENITLETLHVPYQNTHLYGTVSGPISNAKFRPYAQDEFINKCKTDSEFSEKWGLKIEERELDWKKRSKLLSKEQFYEFGFLSPFTDTIINYYLNQKNIPTKLITITYNNETIESYE